jgi:hypothetical protein
MRKVVLGVVALALAALGAFLLAVFLPRDEPEGVPTPVVVTETTIRAAAEPYSVEHVIAALESAGVRLRVFRLDTKACPPGWDICDSVGVTADGKVVDDPSLVEGLPRAQLSLAGGYSPWVVFVYDDPETAEQAWPGPAVSPATGKPLRRMRDENVLVMYEPSADEAQLRELLGRL